MTCKLLNCANNGEIRLKLQREVKFLVNKCQFIQKNELFQPSFQH